MRIPDEKVQEALDYLNNSCVDAARASAERIYVEEYKKVVLARLMKETTGFNTTAASQERDALASDDYAAHLEVIKHAVMNEREHLFRRIAAEATIESWRTQSSNERGAEKLR